MAWFKGGDGYYVYWLNDKYGYRYVGYTENPSRRIGEHRKQKPWFSTIRTVNIRRFATKSEALKTEAFEIEFGEDLYNLDLNRRLGDEAFLDAQAGRFYDILERYDDVPVGRFL